MNLADVWLSQPWETSWPQAIIILGALIVVVVLVGGAMAAWVDLRKARMNAQQDEGLRQLVNRYEQLASTTLDAQQRIATEVSELRARAASIEQILRTVE